METKRCILYIIRVQSGSSLMEILVKPPTEEDEQKWHALARDELSTNSRKRGAYSDANTLMDIGSLSYPALKRTALENIVRLEQAGRITRRNNYQDILNEIAIDIRTKHRRRIQRQRELEGVRLTLDRLHGQATYLEQQLKTYNDYIEQAMITLQNKKGKKRFLMPFTKQWDHQRELQRTGRVFKFGSYKYSARNLADRGVLVHWKGYTERQWDRVDLTISSNEVGVFMIDGSSGNMMVPGASAQVPLDDLLQAQFNNTQFMDLFENQLRVNVNLFLHLIMKKFYNE
jgi:Ras GTPase-activating-like protein IQGAP2/3